ncbi:hypothetical protein ACFSKU_17110 [Pontibacter silvestris]|uniref:Uncharacterized protein n=2 Tax=Pontibacter silvestris TaxID=2305183 RepID=A0ABW4X0T9_9BACT|nr:hypothetical protein [Pontibacter silvestris]
MGATTAFAQTEPEQNRTGRYFIQLQNGETYYANKLQYKSPIFKSNHFLLDDSIKINPSFVNVYENDEGFFARIDRGSSYDAFAKRVLDGPRIDKYYTSRTVYDNGYGYSPYGYGYGGYSPFGFGAGSSRRRIYFFSKDNGPLYELNYNNLSEVLSDNAASMALLNKHKRSRLVNTGVSIVGAGLLAAGAISSINTSQGGDGGGFRVSPAMYAGAGVLGLQFVVNLFQKDKLTQAMEVYNYQLKQ